MENNFEKSLIELENIIKKLESEEVSLDESIALLKKVLFFQTNAVKHLKKPKTR
jgi:exonuclease VII small subunit